MYTLQVRMPTGGKVMRSIRGLQFRKPQEILCIKWEFFVRFARFRFGDFYRNACIVHSSVSSQGN